MKISLNKKDLTDLLSGEIVKKESVEIAVQDIGIKPVLSHSSDSKLIYVILNDD